MRNCLLEALFSAFKILSLTLDVNLRPLQARDTILNVICSVE